ncbi:unnamed protein product, partial [Amoebophrya sp. A25]
ASGRLVKVLSTGQQLQNAEATKPPDLLQCAFRAATCILADRERNQKTRAHLGQVVPNQLAADATGDHNMKSYDLDVEVEARQLRLVLQDGQNLLLNGHFDAQRVSQERVDGLFCFRIVRPLYEQSLAGKSLEQTSGGFRPLPLPEGNAKVRAQLSKIAIENDIPRGRDGSRFQNR